MKTQSRKSLLLFSLKFQRNNQQHALAMNSANGKIREIGHIFTVLWRCNTHMLWQNL